jgi:hypothetical protein
MVTNLANHTNCIIITVYQGCCLSNKDFYKYIPLYKFAFIEVSFITNLQTITSLI